MQNRTRAGTQRGPVQTQDPPDNAPAPSAGRCETAPRNSHTDWPFPFPAPGKPRGTQEELPPRTAYRWPFRPLEETPIPACGVPSPVPLAEFKRAVGAWADDVGVISIDDPAIQHEAAEVRYVYPHARSLICLIGEENKPSMQSRYLPTANHELYQCEERIFEMGRRTLAYIKSLGAEGLTTTIGWPQEVSVRWADKIWPLSHKLVAQAAGLGVIGLSRNLLHPKFGAYCLIDTVVTNLEFSEFDRAINWNPCIECNLCVASCPTDAIKSDGDFDFFACYNHTYRDSIPGFLDLVRDLADAEPKRFEKRWTDVEIAALWQSLAFKVEYRCFNCVATCPAEIHADFHARRDIRRRYLDETLKPLTHTRREMEQQFVIDTPTARRKYDIAPGRWRTDRDDPSTPASRTVRLVDLRRIRSQDIDAMMRSMPQYFRDTESRGHAFTTQFELTGRGGGRWVMRIADGRCRVSPGDAEGDPDLTIRTSAKTMLGLHQGTVRPALAVATGRVRLGGKRSLFLLFPRLFAQPQRHGLSARVAYRLRKLAESVFGRESGTAGGRRTTEGRK